MHNDNYSKERWSRWATLGVPAGDQHRVVMRKCCWTHPLQVFCCWKLLDDIWPLLQVSHSGLCLHPLCNEPLQSQWGVAVCPPSSQMSLLYRCFFAGIPPCHTTLSFNQFASTEACFRSCIFRIALHNFDFMLQFNMFMRVTCRVVDMTLLLKQQPALQCL